MSKKTPMQELIEQLKEFKDYTAKEHSLKRSLPYQTAINYAEQMLDKEREVMCEFALKYAQADRKEPCETSTQLVFEETFNTKEK